MPLHGFMGRFAGLLVTSILGVTALLPHISSAAEAVTLQLKWKHQFQFAGYYVALEKGYYRSVGLDVSIKELQPGIDVVQEVVSGRANYGVGMSDLLLAFQHYPVIPLAVIFQHSPLILLAREDQTNSLHDLAGKTLTIEPQAAELLAYLRQEGLDLKQLHITSHSGSPYELIDKKAAAVSAYSSTEPYILEKAGVKSIRFTPRASGIDFYGDNLFTSKEEVTAHGERAQAFLHASLQGWDYALSHPEETIQLILARYNSQHLTPEALRYEAAETSRLLRNDLIEIGHMNPGRWRHIADTYAELGLLPRNYALNGFLPDRPPTLLPAWVTPTVLSGAVLLCLLGWLTYRSTRLRHQLSKEIAEHHITIGKLQESENHYRLLAENSNDVIWLLDIATDHFTYISPSVMRLRGYTIDEVMARPLAAALTPDSLEKMKTVLAHNLRRFADGDEIARHSTLEVDQPCKDGRVIPTEVVLTIIPNEKGVATTILGITRDISERHQAEQQQRAFQQQLEKQLKEIQSLQSQLQEQVIRDGLTGLYNRRYLDETLPRELARAKREGYVLSLIMIDLDHFKNINDLYGHAAGDEVLKRVAALLQTEARTEDIACRYGGEEFLVVLPKMEENAAYKRAEHWRQQLVAEPLHVNGHAIPFTLSAGIATFPAAATDVPPLLSQADSALYRAKENGRNGIVIATPEPQ